MSGNGRGVYLDNAATSFPKAPGVAAAMARFLDEAAANPGRAGHRMSVAAEALMTRVRERLARLLGVDEPRRVVFTLNCTDALNLAIKGVAGGADRPFHVITTHLEHNSVSRPLQALADAGRIELTRVDFDAAGRVDPADVERALRPATRLVVMSHASNVLGTVQDAAAVGALARRHGALFLLDAAQTAGCVPIDVDELAADLVALPAHKGLLGPTGVGALYVGPRCLGLDEALGDAGVEGAGVGGAGVDGGWVEGSAVGGAARLPGGFHPWREGGTGGDSSTPTQPRAMPHYLEAGTPNTVGVAGLEAALDFLASDPGRQAVEHERRILEELLDRLREVRGLTVYGLPRAAGRVGVVSVGLDGWDPMDAASVLDDSFGIAVRAGLHCAPYAHRGLGTFPQGTLRISPGPFTTAADVDALATALAELAG